MHDITGFSPHYLMFGEQLKLHGGLRDVDVEDGSIPLISAKDSQEDRFRERRDAYLEVQKRL